MRCQKTSVDVLGVGAICVRHMWTIGKHMFNNQIGDCCHGCGTIMWQLLAT
jgi:hypothetical protein